MTVSMLGTDSSVVYRPGNSPQRTTMVFRILGLLALIAAAGMYIVGGNSSHLSELRDFFWAPIPLGVILLALSNRKTG